MSKQKRSDIISHSPSPIMNMFRSGLLHGAGYSTQRLAKRPLIAIANSHNDLTTGHSHLALLATRVREGIIAAGGEAAEFNVPAPCDGVAMAHDGMRYVLAQRDLIADIVETHVRSQPFDGVVMIASCDKINPGMMMAMARLDLPAIYLSGGPGQMNIRNHSEPQASINHSDYANDPELTTKTFTCSTCGACEIMGTANTFQCLAEVLGICIPGSANIPGWHTDKLEAARLTGERIVGLVSEGLNAGQMFTETSMRNAVITNMAIGGSTNATLHLPAIAHAAGLQLNLDDFAAAKDVPTLLAVSPNGPWGIQDVWSAGGMPAVLKQLAPLLDTSTMTVTGESLQATLDEATVRNATIIPPLDKAFRSSAGIAVLKGNLAADGSVIKAAGVHESMQQCSGPARCFDSEEDALIAINNDEVKQGEVVVLRYQGPKGSPGMPEMLGATMALKTKGLNQAALVTDGRFSGATSGPCVGHICPEASDGGVIALVEDGDIIEIDIPNCRLHLQVSDEELARRREQWQPLEKPVPAGFMQRYRKHVRPACEGAVLD
ncbi:dihydroxy-acid dehydratase [Seongchinamella sediminis]|uniref:Dihydroxy-acid dehydratase n=1 Tax=Seongchinamella sediminis TaxID=2283635 RepID=A0A3L7DYK2_9GAMM|nr:dihydroxy-acid dehydratase [Seongchinamella sediminis]RLQ22286.1 dihydroxy-acid dehydratase [Seongchinamella sediminis]